MRSSRAAAQLSSSQEELSCMKLVESEKCLWCTDIVRPDTTRRCETP
jgi:hypothetical protein